MTNVKSDYASDGNFHCSKLTLLHHQSTCEK